MFSNELTLLMILAVSVGFLHTILGPDHYVPFIAMSKAGGWPKTKTFFVTFWCGVGHVLSSALLGFAGVALGIKVVKLTNIEAWRGGMAGWGLIIFGLMYFIWGMRRAFKSKIEKPTDKNSLTLWVLFTIFVFGPCEPLIPVLIYPAAKGNFAQAVLVSIVFGIVTISTMLTVVFAGCYGLNTLPLNKLERFNHALAGLTICLCGLAVQFLGL